MKEIQIESIVSEISPRLKRFKCVIVIRIMDEEKKTQYSALQSKIMGLFPKDSVYQIEDSICVFISSDDFMRSGYEVTKFDEFNETLISFSAFAMISNVTQTEKGIEVFFNECYQVMPIAIAVRYGRQKDIHILKFYRYAFYYTLFVAESSLMGHLGTDDILFLCDPAIITLTRYDRSFNSDLRDVLFTYLMNDRNITRTSQEMFMHRNTINYKVSQLKEIIGTDWLENPYARHNLLSSCMMIRYVEQYKQVNVDLIEIEKKMLKSGK